MLLQHLCRFCSHASQSSDSGESSNWAGLMVRSRERMGECSVVVLSLLPMESSLWLQELHLQSSFPNPACGLQNMTVSHLWFVLDVNDRLLVIMWPMCVTGCQLGHPMTPKKARTLKKTLRCGWKLWKASKWTLDYFVAHPVPIGQEWTSMLNPFIIIAFSIHFHCTNVNTWIILIGRAEDWIIICD